MYPKYRKKLCIRHITVGYGVSGKTSDNFRGADVKRQHESDIHEI